MTKEEMYTNHQILWDFLVRNPAMQKYYAFHSIREFKKPYPVSYCFACQYALEILLESPEYYIGSYCDYCPLDWPGGNCEFLEDSSPGLFRKWSLADTFEERKDIAILIRDLPLKNG